MKEVTFDRILPTRRVGRHGGRRAFDEPMRSPAAPLCPRCHESVAILAGEAEGGWWFVCDACDHLWDQRAVVNRSMPQLEDFVGVSTEPDAPVSSWLSSAANSWWRFASGRPH